MEKSIEIKITLQDEECRRCGAAVVIINTGDEVKIKKCTNAACKTNETLKR